MAKRRVKRTVRPRLITGILVCVALAFLYGYWAPFAYQPTVMREARANHVNPYLVAAVIRVESRFRPTVTSSRGAVGLMQLMPSSAQWINVKRHGSQTPDLTDPKTNIALGTWYLSYLLKRFHGNPNLALAAYNGGPQTVDRWLERGVLSASDRGYQRIPYPETKNFVRRVTLFEKVYRVMYAWLAIRKHS